MRQFLILSLVLKLPEELSGALIPQRVADRHRELIFELIFD